MTRVLTVGHGAATQQEFTALLTGAGVGVLIDIRRYPGSRAHPHFSGEALAGWLPEAGIEYRWAQDLGGRRHLRKDEPSPDTWWKVAAFRAYAGYTRTPEFQAALDEVVTAAEDLERGEARGDDPTSRSTAARPTERAAKAVAIMCSESVWWRCHRRLVADVLVLARNLQVQHLMHDGRLTRHEAAQGARLDANGSLVWDGQA